MELLQRSLLAAVWILIIVGARRLLIHKISAKVFVILWEVVLLRLVFPLAVPFRWSYFGAELGWKYPILREVDLIRVKISGISDMIEYIIRKNHTEFLAIWLLGMCLFFIYFQINYWRSYRLLREALPTEIPDVKAVQLTSRLSSHVEILTSDRIKTPLTYGMFKSRIILPKTYDFTDLKQLYYVLLHEFIHIKNHDNLKKFILMLILCVHWFNPLVWWMYFLLNKDMERTCDRMVIEVVGASERGDYASALVALAEKNFRVTVPCSDFGGMSVKERIISIMKYQKSSIGALVVSAFLFIFSGSIFAAPWVPQIVHSNYSKIEEMRTFGNKDQYMVLTQDIYVKNRLYMSAGYYELINIMGTNAFVYVPVDPVTLERLPNDSLKDGDLTEIDGLRYEIRVRDGNYSAIRKGEGKRK